MGESCPNGRKRGSSQYSERSISRFAYGFDHTVSGRNMVITITDTPLGSGWATYAIRPKVKACAKEPPCKLVLL